MSTIIRFVIFLTFLALVLLGSYFSNHNATEVSLWIGAELGPQKIGVWIIIAFTLGGLLGVIVGFGLLRQIRVQVKLARLKLQLKNAEKQLQNLRVNSQKDKK